MRRFGILLALISAVLCAQDAREVLNQGIAAFKNAHYKEAVEFFQQAATLDPNNVNAHLYLGTAYMSMWTPGAETPGNEALARSARTEFQRILELDANNTVAIASMASIEYNSHKLDDAMDWYKRLAAVDPTNKEAPYSMGVIAWAKWYPALMAARTKLKMRPQDPGPLPAPFREELKAQYGSLIDEGIANLDRALALDPKYDDAMAYLNLLIRERADLLDTKEEYKADVATADAWVQKNLDTKKAKAQSQARDGGGGESRASVPRVEDVALVSKVDPVYPPLAQQARISGTVRFEITIGKEGTVEKVQLVSGHPILVAAAKDAVTQYVYKPTLLNGNPIEVITHVDVNFPSGN